VCGGGAQSLIVRKVSIMHHDYFHNSFVIKVDLELLLKSTQRTPPPPQLSVGATPKPVWQVEGSSLQHFRGGGIASVVPEGHCD